jgi:hypothetical protein
MKKQTLQLASLCWLTLAATPAPAQAKITVTVPFNFMVSDKTFPSGQYLISASRDRLTVQNSTGEPVFIGIANAVSGRQIGETGEVVFHCYDDRCFLAEYWTPTQEYGRQLLPSRYEADLAKHHRVIEFALIEQPTKH